MRTVSPTAITALAMVLALIVAMAALVKIGLSGQGDPAPAALVPQHGARSAPTGENGAYVMGLCTTQLDPGQESRNGNIAVAAEKIDGTQVLTGQEFSFNRVVGERSADSGYGPARVIVDGRNEAGIAGGICQLSSTLYNAALLAGMEIVERRAHSRPVPYLPAGLDATVSYGATDLRWVNTSETSVIVRARVDAESVSVWLEGASPTPEVKLFTEVVEVILPRPAAPPDPTGRAKSPPPPGADTLTSLGAPGYRVRVWAETASPEAGRRRRLVSEDLYEPVNAVAH